MRVGLLTTSYPRHEQDIAGSFVLGFARALALQGHDVEVLAPEPAEPAAARPPPSPPGVRVVHVPYLRPRTLQRTFYGAGVPDNLRADPRAWLGPAPFVAALAAAVIARRARWDAVVSHWALPCGLIAGALRGSLRHVCVLHSADVHLLASMPGGAAASRALVERSDALWFVSELGRRRFLDRLPARAVRTATGRSLVQPMGFDAPPLDDGAGPNRARERARLGLARFTLLTVARLVPVKGLVQAVEALGHRGDLEWLIAGDGPECAALTALAARVRLRVRLLGTVTGADKHALLRAADAFVLPSRVLSSGRTEGVPIALLEAMASGTPVIASRVGGVGEWLTPGETGLAFDPQRLEGLERAVDRLVGSSELSIALAARAKAHVSGLDWTALAPRVSSIVAGR